MCLNKTTCPILHNALALHMHRCNYLFFYNIQLKAWRHNVSYLRLLSSLCCCLNPFKYQLQLQVEYSDKDIKTSLQLFIAYFNTMSNASFSWFQWSRLSNLHTTKQVPTSNSPSLMSSFHNPHCPCLPHWLPFHL